jgi:hypothetical protein
MESNNDPKRRAVYAAERQFDSTLHMLKVLAEVCPNDVWGMCFYDFPYPFWYQMYHMAFFIDFWFRDAYDGSEFRSLHFLGEERIHPEYGHEPDPDLYISRTDMIAYVEKLAEKCARFFEGLDDQKLGELIIPGHDNYTYEDVILGQTRHVMYNIGYLNGILRGLDLPESDWYSYNEKEDEEDA